MILQAYGSQRLRSKTVVLVLPGPSFCVVRDSFPSWTVRKKARSTRNSTELVVVTFLVVPTFSVIGDNYITKVMCIYYVTFRFGRSGEVQLFSK